MEKLKLSIDAVLLIVLFCPISISLDLCENYKCKNGATCQLNNYGQYVCSCALGYKGTYCEEKLNCANTPCLNGGTCRLIAGNYECQCPNEWTGRFCEFSSNCASMPCRNGGICRSLENHKYECHCPKNYFGMNCEQSNLCDSQSPCGVNGKCIPINEGEVKCVCNKGYTGDTCSNDIDECANYDTPLCENGGTCINTVGSYQCKCKSGFNGERCENDIIDCMNGTCKNGGTCLDKIGLYKCVCHNNYFGKNCENKRTLCELKPCKNGGICRDFDEDYQCICGNQWTGKNCEEEKNPCKINPCLNNGLCNSMNYQTYKCICQQGFEGSRCETSIDNCRKMSCLNGGTCINMVDEGKCNCLQGFKGKNCEVNINECENNPCQNNAKCFDQTNDYKCDCPEGLTGKNCEINIDECTPNPCLNEARCEDRVGGFTCRCVQGYVGLRCETKSDVCRQLTPCKSEEICLNVNNTRSGYKCICPDGVQSCKTEVSKCKNIACVNGKCVDENNEEKCICSSGFKGKTCEIEIDECLDNPCQHGSQCQDLINGYFCICLPGFIGKKCEININECENNPCGLNGQCIDEVNGFRCQCTLPYSGPTCSQKLEPCNSNSCLNDAICIPGNKYDSYHCNCSTAFGRYEGTNCEKDINECNLNRTQLAQLGLVIMSMPNSQIGPCLNGNQCINTNGSFICKCSYQYEGRQCEKPLDYCRNDPCRNGATCENLIEGFLCRCAVGFSGERCETEINECQHSPCLNGAKCIDHINDHQCICQSGFSGKNCQINDNDCTESSCLGHGQCIDKVNGFLCNCHENFTGTNCEHLKRPCDSNPCLNKGSCINRKINQNTPGYLCNCRRGFTGPRCEIKMDWCRGNPCGEFGVCETNSDSFKCRCQSEYVGERCEIKKTETCEGYAIGKFKDKSLINKICKHNGNCFNDPETGGFKCSCQSGYGGSFCEVNIDDCANQPCINGGECKDGIGMYSCKCQLGFQGVNCQVNINDCFPHPCNTGKCIDQISNFTCVCPRGVSGRFCETIVDFCRKTECQNGGTCEDVIGDFKCICPKGFTGKLCEIDINECRYNIAGNTTNLISNPHGPCSPTGTLECLDRPGTFLCVCKKYFTGKYCETRIDYCENYRKSGYIPCSNNGICMNKYEIEVGRNLNFSCICPNGYGGDRCKINSKKCQFNVCKNNGVCRPFEIDDRMSFKCECPPGVGGLFCEIDYVNECLSTRCYNNGSCIDGFGKAICQCNKGSCGEKCEITGSACNLASIDNSQTYKDEINDCEINKCASKADNKICDLECNKYACGFDSGECLHRVPKRIDGNDISIASPWSNCEIIKSENIPCHNWFNNKRCDPQCNTEACLFDGWDCMDAIGQCPLQSFCDKHYADGQCQLECNTMECSFDGGDCIESRNSTIPGGIILLLPVSTTEFVTRYQTKLLQSLTHLLHSVVRIMRNNNGQQMIFSIRVFAENSKSDSSNSRQKRSLSNSVQQGKPGTKVYLEVDNNNCKTISRLCFDNSNSAAEFVTAALHYKSYRPPVPILSVQTYHRPGRPKPEPPNGLVYLLVIMTCLVVLGVLVGVLYGFMQNKSQTDDKKMKKAEIWYPEGMKRLNQQTSQFNHKRLVNSNRKRNQNLLNCHNVSSELGNLQQMTKSKISTTDSIDDSGSNSLTSTRMTSYEININENNNENVAVSENCMLLPNGDMHMNFPPEKRLKLHMDAKDLIEPRNIEAWCFNTIANLLVSGNGLGEFSPTESRDKQIIVEKLLQIAVNNQDESNKFTDLFNKNEISNNSLITILTSRLPYSGETLLHLAAKYNRKEAARFLLEAGSDPNKLELNGRSCLMTAIDAGALEVVAYFLEQQTFVIDLHQKGPNGSTCLIQAVKEAHIEIIQLLLQHIQPEECDLNVTDDYGRTALHWAAITGQTVVVHLLLSYGLNRDAQDNEEATPLYLACKEGALEVCKILIANGANPDMSDHLDRLPRDIARMNNFDNIVALLEDYVNITKENQQHRPLMWGSYNCYSNNYYCNNHPVDLKTVLYSSPHSLQQMSCCVYPNSLPQDNIEFKSKNMGFYNPAMSLQNQSNQSCYRSNPIGGFMNQPHDSVKKRLTTHTSPNLLNSDSKMRYHANNSNNNNNNNNTKRNNIKSPNFVDYSSNTIDIPTLPNQVANFYSCSGANNNFIALSGYNTNSNNNPTSSTSAPGITPSPDSDSPGHWSTSSPSLSPRSKNQQHLIMQNLPNGQHYKSSVLHYHPSNETMVLGPNPASIQKNSIYRIHSRDNVCQY